ncbi:Hsp20/alpha crystallin family protein [Halopenitus persicus]|uniref:Heat shock protein Hsp20 n=1 Tax=Halopenitus persicus TaxID=1048396 RepID=A0A1H3KL73_9EURY|nr:Hsp20/alpha crystallin family protein [Halopenitus persicus]SDY52933.1 heat shock protein Hsp20 [Halopenitus persicus]
MQRNPLDEFESLFSTFAGGGQAAVDIAESDAAFVIRVDLPGYDEDDIDVRLTDHTLHVHAEREAESESEDGEAYIRRERSHRAISRTIELPETIDEDAVSATYEDGVLEITLQKEAESKTEDRTIPIA